SENTARWIFREACLKYNAGSNTWLAWGQLEEQAGQLGDYESENTARWIFREACLKYNAGSNTWLAWGQLEEQAGQLGDYESENTARWIFPEGIKRSPKFSPLYLACAYIELSMHSVVKAREILRKSLQYNDYCVGRLAILEFFCGNIDSKDIYCTHNLIMRMEKKAAYSFSALLYLYHCCILLRRTKDAEKYYAQILQNDKYDPSNTSAEDFIELCREAVAAEHVGETQTESEENGQTSALNF
ncbi:MAG: hypothetical protein NC543_13575, partial [bacterium]|nr:hypothetical protein [bacterium]